MKKTFPLPAIFWLMMLTSSALAQSFVAVDGAHFTRDGRPYYFLGANFWYGMNLASLGPGGNRDRMLRELDRLRDLGVTNLRIMAGSEGPDSEPWRMTPSLQPTPGQYDKDLLDGLDFLLAELGKRNMTAVLCLSNFWQWSGGLAQYRSWMEGSAIPYPDPVTNSGWLPYMTYTSGFYKNEKAREAYRQHLRAIITRTNAYTGRAYRDDPAIMAWQLANEPRGMLRPQAFRRWIRRSAEWIKQLDPNHLVCVGSEGNTNTPTGNHFRKDHRSKHIDYTTIHIWVQNWGWYRADRPEDTYQRALEKALAYLQRHAAWAAELGKPIVLEEFGISRDENSHDPASTVRWRDRYYHDVFAAIYEQARGGSAVAGCNFWAWGGEGRPREPHAIWKAGDEWIGDPPHEFQGWYSVYDHDRSTTGIIAEYAAKMQALEDGKKE